MTRFLTILLAGLLLLGFNTPQSHGVTNPTLMGHRGVGDPWTVKLSIPEQSIPAIQWAAAHHADVVEGDVRISGPDSSGHRVLYMMHDDTLDGIRIIRRIIRRKLGHFRLYSSGARSWPVGHYPSASKVKSVSSYATISLAAAEAKPNYVKMLQAAGIKVFIWTLDNSGHYARALPLGAYGWMCDNTQDAWVWLEARGA